MEKRRELTDFIYINPPHNIRPQTSHSNDKPKLKRQGQETLKKEETTLRRRAYGFTNTCLYVVR